MQFDKDTVVNLIREQVGHQQADQAAQQLPDQVDHEEHGGLLQQFGLNPEDLLKRFGGNL